MTIYVQIHYSLVVNSYNIFPYNWFLNVNSEFIASDRL